MCRKSDSEHNLSEVGSTFRVFQGTFPEARKSRGFKGLPRLPGFVGHPGAL